MNATRNIFAPLLDQLLAQGSGHSWDMLVRPDLGGVVFKRERTFFGEPIRVQLLVTEEEVQAYGADVTFTTLVHLVIDQTKDELDRAVQDHVLRDQRRRARGLPHVRG